MDKRYQVFVSSTYTDLKDERRAIIQTLLEMDCIPAGMELFPAADEEQFQFITRIIDDCDYYVLIIGGRYGSLALDGLSYTEKEYDYARAKGLKVLAFLHEKPDSLPLDKVDTAPDRREKLEAFRKKAMTSTVAKLWSEVTSLPAMVAVSLPRTIKLHPAIGWVRANQVASVEILNELNELRLENRNRLEQIKGMTPEFDDLAPLNEKTALSGRHYPKNTGTWYQWKLEPTWSELFSAVGPHIMECPNDAIMHSYFNAAVRRMDEMNSGMRFDAWEVVPEPYLSFKVQMKALKLVDISMQPTVNGGTTLFWSLTPLGESTLIELRAAKAK
jgi:hypothetical protein